jgi:predicted membrane protein
MPDVRYTVDGGQGRLLVCQTALDGPDWHDGAGATWDLRLNDRLPIDLSVALGVGRSTITVGGLNLTALSVRTGVGETILDLDGVDSDLDVRISGGIGEIAIRVPQDIGVLVDTDTGIADVKAPGFTRTGSRYANEQYGKTNTTIRIVLDQGIGDVSIRQVA